MTALALTSGGKDGILPSSTLSCTIRSKRNVIGTWGPLKSDKTPLSLRDQTKSQRVAREVHSARESPIILWRHGQDSHQGSILVIYLKLIGPFASSPELHVQPPIFLVSY